MALSFPHVIATLPVSPQEYPMWVLEWSHFCSFALIPTLMWSASPLLGMLSPSFSAKQSPSGLPAAPGSLSTKSELRSVAEWGAIRGIQGRGWLYLHFSAAPFHLDLKLHCLYRCSILSPAPAPPVIASSTSNSFFHWRSKRTPSMRERNKHEKVVWILIPKNFVLFES